MSRQLRTRALWLLCVGLLCCAFAARTQAQIGPEPRLSFSIFGGVANYGHLWDVPKQPLTVTWRPELWDTLALNRSLNPSLLLGLNATLYRSSHLGFTAEIVYLGLKSDDEYEMEWEHLDLQRLNNQVCNSITASTRTVSNIGMSAGVAYRLLPRAAVKPYGRLQVGVSLRSSSLIDMSGVYQQQRPDGSIVVQSRAIIADPSATSVHPLVIGAIGLTFALSPGYQLRAEVRDHLLILERPTGPAELAQVETEHFIGHSPALVFGFDVVLEQRRGRRY